MSDKHVPGPWLWYLIIAVLLAVAWYANDYLSTHRDYEAYEACEKAHQFEHAADLECPDV